MPSNSQKSVESHHEEKRVNDWNGSNLPLNPGVHEKESMNDPSCPYLELTRDAAMHGDGMRFKYRCPWLRRPRCVRET